MNFRTSLLAVLTSLSVLNASASEDYYYYRSSVVKPPPLPAREFRGVWVASVANIDWPSKPGLPVNQQKTELLAILDSAAKMHLNAVILQVRPACDALYASELEPWSYYLTGTMGQAPAPFYDPLAFAVEQAHNRGLELHAWFNPYRAGVLSAKPVFPPNHISKTHPELVRHYGGFLWLDPGEKAVQDYSLRVVMDVVKRYDIDGVHFDDYFYPYKEADARGKEMDFPDEASWRKYGAGGKLSRDDWRRENVNMFVRRVYESIKAVKPWVKFGVSPFGIWQPGYPKQIKGFNSYATLYCDSRKWLENGWMDYCAPQLYWSIENPDQSFPVLYKWWLEQDRSHRNIWPGLDSEKVGRRSRGYQAPWTSAQIENQIKITRGRNDGAPGVIHWSIKALMQDRGGLATSLTSGLYCEPALIPSFPWLERKRPSKPVVVMHSSGTIEIQPPPTEQASLWIIQTRTDNRWSTKILPAGKGRQVISVPEDVVAVTMIDRCGMASPPNVMQKFKHTPHVRS